MNKRGLVFWHFCLFIFLGVGFSCSNGSSQSFKSKLAEVENDPAFSGWAAYDYAASNHSIETYKKRFDEALKDTTFINNMDVFVSYARSNHSIETYKKRLNEVATEIDGLSVDLQAFYAESKHSIKTFEERLNESRKELTGGNFYYAASNHSLQTYIKRLDEADNDPVLGKNNAIKWRYAASNHKP